MDGLLDWYLLGVLLALGLASAVGALAAGRTPRTPGRSAVFAALALLATALAVAIVVAELPWWAIGAWLAGAALGLLVLRRLSTRALPAAFVAAIAAAAIPATGYLAALAAPVVGYRLRRRAGERYAGLRVLARD